MFCKFTPTASPAIPPATDRRPSIELRKPPYRVARARLSNGLRLLTIETPHLHTRQRLPLRAGRLALRDGRRRTACRTSWNTCCSADRRRYPELVRAEPGDRGAGRHAVRRDRTRLLALPDHAAPEAGGARAGDPGRSVLRRRRSATSTSSGRSSSRRSSRTSTTAGATSTSTTSRASWPGASTRSASRSPGRCATCGASRSRDVRAHFRRFYGAANMVLAVAGPLSARARRARRRGRRSRACRAARGGGRARPRPNGRGPRFRAVHNESAQTQVHVLFHALPETDPGYLALRALVRVLDDGMSTRLHYQICDQKGLAYSVAGLAALVPRRRAAGDRRRLRARQAAGAGDARRWRCSAASARSWSARTSSTRPSAASSATSSRRYDDLDGLCGWFGGTELYCAADPQEKRARALARVRPERHPRRSRAACCGRSGCR